MFDECCPSGASKIIQAMEAYETNRKKNMLGDPSYFRMHLASRFLFEDAVGDRNSSREPIEG